METGNLPMDRFRAGGVTAALWDNQVQFKGKPVRLLKVSIERRYKDKNGLWQSSTSFGRNEIPLAIYCLQQAFDKIIQMQNEELKASGEVEEIEISDDTGSGSNNNTKSLKHPIR